ncbi:MAG: hypothetical protein N3C63_04290 [Rhodocyclaceae bacterium]|nr:hypothetical protein [Rhodocyclaceae bacterium]
MPPSSAHARPPAAAFSPAPAAGRPELKTPFERLRLLGDRYVEIIEHWSCKHEDVMRLSTLTASLVGLADAAPEVALGMGGRLGFASPAMQHAFHVAIVSILLGRRLKLGVPALFATAKAALLMNLPIFELQDDLAAPLAKPTRGQSITLRNHPLLAAELVAASPGADLRWIEAIEQHHESLGGSGYPLGLKGDEITQEARILKVADIWCALTDTRPHRSGLSPREALHCMRARSRPAIDAEVFDALVELMGAYPPGTLVRLANREVAIVTTMSPAEHPPPRVIAILSPQNHLLREPVLRETDKPATAVRGYSLLPQIEIRPGYWNAVWHQRRP